MCGPGELYHVPITCTNAVRPSEELFPDLHDFSRSDFGLGAKGYGIEKHEGAGKGRTYCGPADDLAALRGEEEGERGAFRKFLWLEGDFYILYWDTHTEKRLGPTRHRRLTNKTALTYARAAGCPPTSPAVEATPMHYATAHLLTSRSSLEVRRSPALDTVGPRLLSRGSTHDAGRHRRNPVHPKP